MRVPHRACACRRLVRHLHITTQVVMFTIGNGYNGKDDGLCSGSLHASSRRPCLIRHHPITSTSKGKEIISLVSHLPRATHPWRVSFAPMDA